MTPLSPADDAFAETLRPHLPEGALRRAEARYLEEPRGRWQGVSGWVALPRTADEVATILRFCTAARAGVLPYGGGTGLVGGQIAPDGAAPLLVSLERMTAIRAVHPEENVLIAEAGAILTDVQAAAERADRLFPLSLASEGSARIGGLLSTNAGGVNVLRYGNAREMVLGLEAVLPDGSVWHGLKRLRKDNTGYDLRHLLMGAEGTLGIITAAALKLSPRPPATGVALLAVRDPAAALTLLARAREAVGEAVSAFELMHRTGFAFLAETLPDLRQPWTEPPEWCVLVELGLPRGLDPQGTLESLFEAGFEQGLVLDGLIAQSQAQAADFWALREHIPEANRRIGAVSSHDISLPLGAVAEFITRAGPALAELGDWRINCFGHLGDGNLHYNVFPVPGRSRADHDQPARRGQDLPARPHACAWRVGQRRARDRAAQDRRPRALRRSRQARGDARDQGRARPRRHHESRRGPAACLARGRGDREHAAIRDQLGRRQAEAACGLEGGQHLRHVVAGFGEGRHAAMFGNRILARIVPRKDEDRIALEGLHQEVEKGHATADVLPGIEGVADAEARGRGRHQLHQPLRAGLAHGILASCGFDRDHRQHERRGDLRADSGAQDVGPVRRRDVLQSLQARRWHRLALRSLEQAGQCRLQASGPRGRDFRRDMRPVPGEAAGTAPGPGRGRRRGQNRGVGRGIGLGRGSRRHGRLCPRGDLHGDPLGARLGRLHPLGREVLEALLRLCRQPESRGRDARGR